MKPRMTKPRKISIIMPVYNVEKYVGRAIESVLSQEYANFELIVVNDGSTDRSPGIIESYSESDKRVKILHKKNGGLSDARNFGIDHSTGDYLIFIDSDDYWETHTLTPLATFVESNNLDVALFGYVADFYDKNDDLSRSMHIIEAIKIVDKSEKSTKVDIQNIQLLGYAWNKIYSASLVRDNKLRFQKGVSYIEDILFNQDIYHFAKRIGFFDKTLYHYSQRYRETLGVKYYPNMAFLDLKANKAFCKSLEHLGVASDEIDTFRDANMLSKSRWTARVVSTTNKIGRLKKKQELSLVADNITNIKLVSNGVLDQLYLYLFKSKQLETVLMLESLRTGKLLRYISDFVQNRHKAELIYALSPTNLYQSIDKKQKKIIVTLAADYGNLGDVAITYAQKKFLGDNFKDYKVITLPISATYHNLKSLKRRMTSKDIVTIVGGGNMGDMYEDIEEQRRFIIRKFKYNRVISFPQTIDFSDSTKGILSQKRSQKVYNSHKNLILFAREKKSYAEMKRLFCVKVLLSPDIVLSLDKSTRSSTRSKSKAVICIRQDGESSLSKGQKMDINDLLYNTYDEVEYRDTHIGDVRLSDDEAKRALEDIWDCFRSADLVVTDRLHGMIFCAITQTPCIAINNSNGKVAGVYKLWVEGLNNVILLENIDKYSIESSIEVLKNRQSIGTRILRGNFDKIENIINNV